VTSETSTISGDQDEQQTGEEFNLNKFLVEVLFYIESIELICRCQPYGLKKPYKRKKKIEYVPENISNCIFQNLMFFQIFNASVKKLYFKNRKTESFERLTKEAQCTFASSSSLKSLFDQKTKSWSEDRISLDPKFGHLIEVLVT
jgi:hypothetical protein